MNDNIFKFLVLLALFVGVIALLKNNVPSNVGRFVPYEGGVLDTSNGIQFISIDNNAAGGKFGESMEKPVLRWMPLSIPIPRE